MSASSRRCCCAAATAPIPENERRKIALFCNVRPEAVIAALDVDTIYAVPISYHAEGMDREVLRHFGLPFEREPDLARWQRIVESGPHRRKARCASRWSANTPTCSTATNRWPRRWRMAASPTA